MDSKRVTALAAIDGGKGASLAVLREAAQVPPFQTVGTDLFLEFLGAHGWDEMYRRYWQAVLAGSSPEALDRVRASLIRAILLAPLPPSVAERLTAAYEAVPAGVKVARSSASVEDGPTRSWAGQFRTVFGITSPDDWLTAVRQCWAEVATPSVAGYGRAAGPDCPAPRMAVVLQGAVDAVASGVVFSHDPTAAAAGPLVEATWGLGGPLVAGAVTPERWSLRSDGTAQLRQSRRQGTVWLLAAGRDTTPSASHFLSIPGATLEIRVTGAASTDGVLNGVPILAPDRCLPVLAPDQAQAILAFAATRATAAGSPVELEWAIDKNGEVWWLQERPITTLRHIEVPGATAGGDRALITGVCGSSGLTRGPGWWSEEPRPDSPGARPILFKNTTSPADVPILVEVGGLVTQDGGVLSHSAIVARELSIPCLIGASPFPPNVAVRGTMELDASRGEVRSVADDGPSAAAAPVGRPDTPPVIALSAPEPETDRSQLRWWTGPDLAGRISPELVRHLDRVATVPGVLGPVDLLPDLKEAHQYLGFPVGVAFRSERFHPTAVSDCGDGFRLSTICDVRAVELRQRSQRVIDALARWLGESSPAGAAVRAEVSIAEIFRSGMGALSGSRWAERHPERVEDGGWIPGGSAQALDAELIALARRCLAWHGEAGHFLELLAPARTLGGLEPDPDAPAQVFFHTGSMELGLAFLHRAVQRGLPASGREGLDDADSQAAGLWGVEITGQTGRSLLATAIGLVNYSFARRAILQHLVEGALSEALERPCRLDLVSDVVHTAVRPDRDALLHQQGVQSLRPASAPVPLVIAGAPRVASYLVEPRTAGAARWCCHGKANVTPRPEFLRPEAAQWAQDHTILVGPAGNVDPVVADAQTREAIAALEAQDIASPIRTLLPLVCFRGNQNGRPKLVVKSSL